MMSIVKQLLIFGVGLVVASVLYHFINHNTKDSSQLTSAVQLNPGFDYFVFALQWPAAFCNIQRNKPRNCNPDPPLPKHQDKFTVHGLWPQLNGGVSPLYCSPGPPMQNSDLSVFQNDLLDYWPDLFSARNFQSSMSFWKRQWNKHGKCSSDKFNPQQYLRITINLARNHAKHIFDELVKQGIKPDGTTARREADLREAVRQITGYYPMLNIQLNDSGEHLLLEIRLCVNNDGVTLFHCDPLYIFAAP